MLNGEYKICSSPACWRRIFDATAGKPNSYKV
jgi:hypothetical protein